MNIRRLLVSGMLLLLLLGGGVALSKEFFMGRGVQGTGPGTPAALFTAITPSNLNFTAGANVLVGTAASALNFGTNTSAWSAQTSGLDSNGVTCNNYSAFLSVSDAQSTAPSGPTLINTDGTWTWGAAAPGRPGEYNLLLNGTLVGIGLFAEIFNGQIYANTATGGWFVYNAGFVGASAPPNPGFIGVITAKASAPIQSYPGTCLRVTQSGVGNSPYSRAFTFVGTSVGANFTSITLPTTTSTAGTAGTVGTASSAVNSGVNSPTWSIKTSGTDSATGATCNNYPYFSITTAGVPTGIMFSPTNPSLPDNSATGTSWATASVAMNSGPFTGSLTSSNTSLFTISGLNINTARTMGPADDGVITTSITATQNNQTGILTVNANAPAQSYPGTCLQVTQAGVANSPYSQAFTLTSTAPAGPNFTSITLSNLSFPSLTAGTVGTASSTVNSGVNSPTWSIKTSGTDSATGATCNNYPYFSISTVGVPTGITFSPTSPSIPDNSAVGTLWATASVAMNSGPFTGILTSSNTDLFAISGLNINTARVMTAADDGSVTTTITATQNNQTGILTVNANAPAQSYPGICLQVTQAGVANSPYSTAFTLVGQ